MLIIQGNDLEMSTNKTYYVLSNTHFMNTWWRDYIIFYSILAVAIFQITFYESWKKVQNLNRNSQVQSSIIHGITIGRKRNILYAVLAIFVIFDDWRFLFLADFDSYIELFFNYMTNLVGIVYVICNIYFMKR